LSKLIDETRNIGDTWDELDDPGRKTNLDYWVYDVLLVVEPIPGMKKANKKTALVTLRTAPPRGPGYGRRRGAGLRRHFSRWSEHERADVPLCSLDRRIREHHPLLLRELAGTG